MDVDPLALNQLAATQSATDAAWRALTAYWFSFGATVLSLVVSAFIAAIAVRGPERERHTRALEARIQEGRLYERAADAGLRGLRVCRQFQSYLTREEPLSDADWPDINAIRRRFEVRMMVVEHFADMALRDPVLVGLLFEVEVLMKSLSIVMTNDASSVALVKDDAQEIFQHRRTRMKNLRAGLNGVAEKVRERDDSLQDDLADVWGLFWILKFWWKPKTERD